MSKQWGQRARSKYQGITLLSIPGKSFFQEDGIITQHFFQGDKCKLFSAPGSTGGVKGLCTFSLRVSAGAFGIGVIESHPVPI